MPTHLHKLKKTLAQLNKDTLRRWQLFLHSPYFKISNAEVELFEYMLPLHPKFAEALTTPTAIAKACRSLATAKTQANNASMLLQRFHTFMAVEQMQQTPGALHFFALQHCQQQGRSNWFKTLIAEAETTNQKCPVQNSQTWLYRHLLTELKYTGAEARLKRYEDMDLQPVIDTMDDFHALKKIRYLCEAIQRHYSFGTTMPPADERLLRPALLQANAQKQPYAFLFAHVYQMLRAEDFATGYEFMKPIKRFASIGYSDSLYSAFTEVSEYCKSWCLRWINRGHKELMKEYLWWIDYKITHGLVLQKAILLPAEFYNTISIAYHLAMPAAWIQQYADQYHRHLPEKLRQSYYEFGKGVAAYAAKRYTEAIRCFMRAQIKHDDVVNAATRQWEFMARYDEMEIKKQLYDTDDLHHLLDAFSKYLHRHQPRIAHVTPRFRQFVQYARLLTLVWDDKAPARLPENFTEQEHFPGKAWLGQKFNTLPIHDRKTKSATRPGSA